MTVTATDLRVQADSYRQTATTLTVPALAERYLGWAAELEQRAAALDDEAKVERKAAQKAARVAKKAEPVEQGEDAELWA